MSDEQKIRDLIAEWHRASMAGDLARVLTLMAEDVVSGPAHLVPAPLRAVAIAARNRETLRRLALLAEVPAP